MVKTVRVYRVETKDGTGPYHGNLAEKVMNTCCSDRHPMCYNDGLPYNDGTARFGFSSVRKLQWWFHKEERQKLAALGLKCSIYEVPVGEIQKGRRQVMFRKDKSKKIGTMDDLFKCK